MKKLMIAAAIVCAAVMAQAANVSWKSSAGWVVEGADDENGLDGNKVYFIDANAYSTATMIEALGAADATESTIAGMSLDNATINEGEWAVEHAAKDLTTGGDGYASLYAVIVSDDGKNYFIYDDYNPVKVTSAVESGYAVFSADDDVVTGAQSSWTAIAAPEPTSGLLLLIGVAGLALKRRRA